MDKQTLKQNNADVSADNQKGSESKKIWNKAYKDTETREISMMFEYKMLQLYGALYGVYVVPQLDNPYVWHGSIFVRQGFYKQGKFKFVMRFPVDFPAVPPSITFRSKLYHSLVNLETGSVDLKALLPDGKWSYPETLVSTVFSGLKSMFVDQNKLKIPDSENPEAAAKYNQQIHAFLERVMDCVEQSKDKLYHNEPDTSLILRPHQKEHTAGIKAKVGELCRMPNVQIMDKKKMLMDFLLN